MRRLLLLFFLPLNTSTNCHPVVFQDRKEKLRQHLSMLLNVEPAQMALSEVESILNPRVKLGALV